MCRASSLAAAPAVWTIRIHWIYINLIETNIWSTFSILGIIVKFKSCKKDTMQILKA